MATTVVPANIRNNITAPFPSLVTSTGPITIAKTNGIWSVGFNMSILGTQVPLVGAYPTDFLVIYDAVANTHFKTSITNFLSSIAITSGSARNQRSVTASPIVIAGSDQILNINISSGSPTCALPAASSRVGVPLTFKDVGSQFVAHNLTITPNGGDTIDGLASIVLTNNRQVMTLTPFNDGTNTGWAIT